MNQWHRVKSEFNCITCLKSVDIFLDKYKYCNVCLMNQEEAKTCCDEVCLREHLLENHKSVDLF